MTLLNIQSDYSLRCASFSPINDPLYKSTINQQGGQLNEKGNGSSPDLFSTLKHALRQKGLAHEICVILYDAIWLTSGQL